MTKERTGSTLITGCWTGKVISPAPDALFESDRCQTIAIWVASLPYDHQ
jgi:hypothetical protein